MENWEKKTWRSCKRKGLVNDKSAKGWFIEQFELLGQRTIWAIMGGVVRSTRLKEERIKRPYIFNRSIKNKVAKRRELAEQEVQKRGL